MHQIAAAYPASGHRAWVLYRIGSLPVSYGLGRVKDILLLKYRLSC